MEQTIEFRDVTKRYGDVTALEGVSLNVMKGEILTVLGPNGSGKTTTLRIMAGIEKPTSGEVYFDGARVDDGNRSEARKRSTMVFQRATLFNTTVYDNVAYGLKVRGCPRREIKERVRDALKLVRLEGYDGRLAVELSGGEQQRVSIARALVLDTELLLLDEPTANLDPKNVSIIEEIISWVNRERKATVVMATHNMFQAEALTDRVALLLGGRIAEVGTVYEVFGAPSRYLQGFARLENVFSGTSKITEGGTSLIDVGNGIQIEAALQKSGRVTIYTRPEDIILSRRPIESSARNVFKGRVVSLSDLGVLIRLRVDVGREFVVQITKRSFVEMRLNVGSEVFLTFKASSVHII
ncbi:MAG: ABC transporter ATP-binding protein [Candidatus Bathyarchaeia archaeon]